MVAVVAVVEVRCPVVSFGGDLLACRSASKRGDLQELESSTSHLNCYDLRRKGHWAETQWRPYLGSPLCLRLVSFFIFKIGCVPPSQTDLSRSQPR